MSHLVDVLVFTISLLILGQSLLALVLIQGSHIEMEYEPAKGHISLLPFLSPRLRIEKWRVSMMVHGRLE